jgi:hypothetical protein
MAELLEVVADAVRSAGGRARTVVGGYPEPASDTVYVVVPHEYFVVSPDTTFPSAELCRRTIGFCVEHPGTATFEGSAGLVRCLGAAVDINQDSANELSRRGIQVEHFQLGYSPLWDLWGGDLDHARDIDVTYLATAERRRSILLGTYAPELSALRTRLLTPPHEMMSSPRVDFLMGKVKLAHLSRSRFLLNLHRERKQTLEWVRALEAMCNGSVLVTEPSTDVEPMVSGEHLVIGRAESLGAIVAGLAEDPDRERRIRKTAYEFVKNLDLAASAQLLVELARRICNGQTPAPPDGVEPARALAARLRSPENALAIDTPSWDVRFAGDRSLPHPASPPGKAVKQIAMLVSTARVAGTRRWVSAAYAPSASDGARVDVDVLLVRRPGEVDPDNLVNDLITGEAVPNRVLVGEDGVTPSTGSLSRPYDLLEHQRPLGRGLTRNALLARSTAEWLLVLDGGMRASRYLLARLLTVATDGVNGADVVHCPVADPVDGLVAALPPEIRRLRTIPYLGSGYLVRRTLVDDVGGWTEDYLFEGLEDHVFWGQVATADCRCVLVQQVLLRRVRPEPEPRPIDLDPHMVWDRVNRVLFGS